MSSTGNNGTFDSPKEYESITLYMAKHVVSFRPEQSIFDAIDRMLEHNISGGPVLNEKGDIIGILSTKDCLKIMVDESQNNQNNNKGVVEDYMTNEVITVDVSSNVLDVANMFLSSNFRRYPVIENGKLVGQVSRRDVMKAAAKLKGTA